MAKDPAILFYPGDWVGGTMGMTFEEKGAYMELLMMQFHRGHMTTHMIGQTVGQLWVNLQVKFAQDDEGLWYNPRLDEEKDKRKKFVESRKNNIKGNNQHKSEGKKGGRKTGHMTSHMENENENENINRNRDEDENKSEYENCVKYWFDFYENRAGIKPKFGSIEGTKMKSILHYLSQLTKEQNSSHTPGQLFKAILDNWERIPDKWIRENAVDLKIFESKINIIINGIKKQTDKTSQFRSRVEKYQ